uniref:Fucolectin tachylectin-4 pentraxin-1 domain-containing protein n=1 Tax=Amphimedon queenslandica TaxID=400682 RepID=A0A1X7TF79_AMPQE
MSDATENCPSGFRLYQSGGVRACGRTASSVGSCVSVRFPSNGISYSQVCGRVVGYQYASTDAVDSTTGTNAHNDINSYYVDGSFIGNDYFCESGNPATDGSIQSILYASDPLWDGKGCGSLEGVCCAAPGLPWFNKILNTSTTDYLELRVCADEGTSNEDVPVSFYELYVK